MGTTPSIFAARHEKYRILYYLLGEGADFNLKDSIGHDLAFACYLYPQDLKHEFPVDYEYNQKVLKFLEEKGVDLKAAKERVDKHMGR